MIVGLNQGVSFWFVSSLQLQKSMRKGCKLYAILALNEKGVEEGLEHLPVVKEFTNVFPRGVSWDAARKGTGVYHRPETGGRTNGKNSLSYVDPGVARVENSTEGVVGPGTDTS
jgi:hypothetical protein